MLGRPRGPVRERESSGMATVRSTLAVFLAAVALIGCSSSGSVSSSRLPRCADINAALLHVGMVGATEVPSSTPPGPVRTNCAFSSHNRYGLTAIKVLILRPLTVPYEGQSLDDWAKATLATDGCNGD